MMQFILGVALGIYLATHGVMGVATAVDESVKTIKSVQITTESK